MYCGGNFIPLGPSHGGANEAVPKMLGEIGSRWYPGVLEKANPQDNFRPMGFGHRVYKNYDPRAGPSVTRANVLDALGIRDEPLLKMVMELEKIALEDDYFVQRKLFPNVDFYSHNPARWASWFQCSPSCSHLPGRLAGSLSGKK